MLLAHAQCKARICEGLSPWILDPPVAVLVEPFAFAAKHKTDHANRILANAFATRLETAAIERDCYQYIFHIGLANAGGAMLDSREEIARAAAANVYQLCRHWNYIKARFVDTVDNGKISGGYTGQDVPEHIVPVDQWPSYAGATRPRFTNYDFFSPDGDH